MGLDCSALEHPENHIVRNFGILATDGIRQSAISKFVLNRFLNFPTSWVRGVTRYVLVAIPTKDSVYTYEQATVITSKHQ